MTRALDFPATRRNRDPILRVLKEQLPPSGSLLEIAAGSGQHAVAFAAHLPQWTWTPTDLDPLHVDSITATPRAPTTARRPDSSTFTGCPESFATLTRCFAPT